MWNGSQRAVQRAITCITQVAGPDQQIDTQLIRSYGTYFRADVPGLAAGSYTLKVTSKNSFL